MYTILQFSIHEQFLMYTILQFSIYMLTLLGKYYALC